MLPKVFEAVAGESGDQTEETEHDGGKERSGQRGNPEFTIYNLQLPTYDSRFLRFTIHDCFTIHFVNCEW